MKKQHRINPFLALAFCLIISFGACKKNKKEATEESTPKSVVDTPSSKENKTKEAKLDMLPKMVESLYIHCQRDTIRGIDVSHFQGRVNWDKIREDGLHLGIVKATEGTRYVDPKFRHNWKHIPKSKLVRGAYHFYSPNEDPIEQAKHFLKVVGSLGRYDLAPFLDLEGENIDHITIKEYQTNVKKWLHYVERECGKRPIIYTNYLFANKYLNDSRFSEHKLWLAEYRTKDIILPKVWKKESWIGWQFSDHATATGVRGKVDESRFLSKYIYQGKSE